MVVREVCMHACTYAGGGGVLHALTSTYHHKVLHCSINSFDRGSEVMGYASISSLFM